MISQAQPQHLLPTPSSAQPDASTELSRASSGQLSALINKYIETPKKKEREKADVNGADNSNNNNNNDTDDGSHNSSNNIGSMKKQRSEYTFESLFFNKKKQK